MHKCQKLPGDRYGEHKFYTIFPDFPHFSSFGKHGRKTATNGLPIRRAETVGQPFRSGFYGV